MKNDEKVLHKKYKKACLELSDFSPIFVSNFCFIGNYGIPAHKGGDFFIVK